MKKTSLYITFALLALVGITACVGRNFDPDQDMKDLSDGWACEYVDNVLDQKIRSVDSSFNKKWSVTTSMIKDTLYKEIHNTYSKKYPLFDSVEVTSTFIQIRDSLIVKVDGYRYSEKYWAHLFTVGDGILDYEGKFRVEYYEIGEKTPWGWTETTYRKNEHPNDRKPYLKKTKVGWY